MLEKLGPVDPETAIDQIRAAIKEVPFAEVLLTVFDMYADPGTVVKEEHKGGTRLLGEVGKQNISLKIERVNDRVQLIIHNIAAKEVVEGRPYAFLRFLAGERKTGVKWAGEDLLTYGISMHLPSEGLSFPSQVSASVLDICRAVASVSLSYT